jgi:hypothetical protein
MHAAASGPESPPAAHPAIAAAWVDRQAVLHAPHRLRHNAPRQPRGQPLGESPSSMDTLFNELVRSTDWVCFGINM